MHSRVMHSELTNYKPSDRPSAYHIAYLCFFAMHSLAMDNMACYAKLGKAKLMYDQAKLGHSCA